MVNKLKRKLNKLIGSAGLPLPYGVVAEFFEYKVIEGQELFLFRGERWWFNRLIEMAGNNGVDGFKYLLEVKDEDLGYALIKGK